MASRPLLHLFWWGTGGYLGVMALIFSLQRQLLYYPTHRVQLDESFSPEWKPWFQGKNYLGFCREAERPRAVWLMLHGNAGEALLRAYVLPHIATVDSLYVLEYPGYGARAGNPSRTSFDTAAREAYESLLAKVAPAPVCILGESIGSGPACTLGSATPSPAKIVLVTPFDRLLDVAAEHFPYLPVSWLLRDRWDNIAALKNYRGPVEIYGARDDTIIPVAHARKLAAAFPQSEFHLLNGGHNDWSSEMTGNFSPPP